VKIKKYHMVTSLIKQFWELENIVSKLIDLTQMRGK